MVRHLSDMSLAGRLTTSSPSRAATKTTARNDGRMVQLAIRQPPLRLQPEIGSNTRHSPRFYPWDLQLDAPTVARDPNKRQRDGGGVELPAREPELGAGRPMRRGRAYAGRRRSRMSCVRNARAIGGMARRGRQACASATDAVDRMRERRRMRVAPAFALAL